MFIQYFFIPYVRVGQINHQGEKMKKILFSLLCFSLVSVASADMVLAKRVKKSSVTKKKKAARYRAYKSFYRRQMRRLRKKSNWSVGVYGGFSALTLEGSGSVIPGEQPFELKPVGLSMSYNVKPFLSVELNAAFNTGNIDIPHDNPDDPTAIYRLSGLASFSGFLKLQKRISKKILGYAKLGYTTISIDEDTLCFTGTEESQTCGSFDQTSPESGNLGLWGVGAGMDFFVKRNFSLGAEIIYYIGGIKSALKDSSNSFSFNANELALVLFSAKYHF